MTTTKRKLLTAEDLLELHSKGIKGELIRGVFCETVSTGIEHGEIAANFSGEIRTFSRPKRLGRVFTSDSGIRLERGPDTVREPDVGFISAERLPLGTRVTGYSDVVPELVIEIVSPRECRHIHRHSRFRGNPKAIGGSKCVFARYRILGSRFRGNDGNTRYDGNRRLETDILKLTTLPSDTVSEMYDRACMWLRHGVTLVWVTYPDTRTVDVYRQDGPTVTLFEDDVLDGAPVLPGFTLPVREVFE